jgi:hypothetical protein
MPPASMEWVDRVKAKTEAVTYAEAVRNALKLYAYMLAHTEAGNSDTRAGSALVADPFEDAQARDRRSPPPSQSSIQRSGAPGPLGQPHLPRAACALRS